MSLFGSGRRDGVLAVLLLCSVTLFVYGVAAVRGVVIGDDAHLQTTMTAALAALREGHTPSPGSSATGPAFAPILYPPWWLLCLPGTQWLWGAIVLHAAMAGAGFYRFLRRYGRSRYAAFLGGAIYGLGLAVTARRDDLPALAAAAWLPFGLEAGLLLRRHDDRRFATAYLGISAAMPWLAGGQAAALVTSGFAGLFALSGWRRVQRSGLPALRRSLTTAAAIALLLSTPAWFAAGERWLGRHAPAGDFAVRGMFQLVPASATVFLVLLGILRWQRHVSTTLWLLVAATGAGAAWLLPPWFPVAGFGDATDSSPLLLLHVALPVIATAGLDDFLDLPQRRRYAVPVATVLVAIATGFAIAGSVSLPEAHALAPICRVLLPVLGPAVGIGALFHLWRGFGAMMFKTILAAIVLGSLSVQASLELASSSRHAELAILTGNMPAAPEVDRILFDGDSPAPLQEHAMPLVVAMLPPLKVDDSPRSFTVQRHRSARMITAEVGVTEADYEVEIAAGEGLLVLAGAWQPGWSATLDGVSVPLLRTSTQQRAVLMPAGHHRVHVGYRAGALLLGLPAVLLGLAGLIALALRDRA